VKTVLITFFGTNCIVHFKFIAQDQAVNCAYYMEILKQLFESVSRKRPELWPNDWIISPWQWSRSQSFFFKQFLDRNSIT